MEGAGFSIKLMPVDLDDSGFFYDLYSDWSVARYLNRVPYPFSMNDAERIVQGMIESNRDYRNRNLVVWDRKSGDRCGVVVLNCLSEKRAVLGFSVLPRFNGRGIATRSSRDVLSLALEIGYREVQASPLDENLASRRVLEKLGFRVDEEGILEASVHSGMRRCSRWVLSL